MKLTAPQFLLDLFSEVSATELNHRYLCYIKILLIKLISLCCFSSGFVGRQQGKAYPSLTADISEKMDIYGYFYFSINDAYVLLTYSTDILCLSNSIYLLS